MSSTWMLYLHIVFRGISYRSLFLADGNFAKVSMCFQVIKSILPPSGILLKVLFNLSALMLILYIQLNTFNPHSSAKGAWIKNAVKKNSYFSLSPLPIFSWSCLKMVLFWLDLFFYNSLLGFWIRLTLDNKNQFLKSGFLFVRFHAKLPFYSA